MAHVERARSPALSPATAGAAVQTVAPDVAATVVWRIHGFDYGDARYGFETSGDGRRARVVVNSRTALELPLPVWHALLDCLHLQNSAEGVPPDGPRRVLPARTGMCWSAQEDELLRQARAANRAVPDIALEHGRTIGAITSRLNQLGLIEFTPARPLGATEPSTH